MWEKQWLIWAHTIWMFMFTELLELFLGKQIVKQETVR